MKKRSRYAYIARKTNFTSLSHRFKIGLIIKYLCFITFIFAIFCNYATGQNKKEPVKTTRILFILDASGSMLEKWEGKTRMEVAKNVLAKIVDTLRGQKNLELALRIYGHQSENRLSNCKDTKLEVPFLKANHDAIISKIKNIKPKGTTLISYSIEQSANDFPKDPDSRNVIILITDGIEACGGDPCALSLALQEKRIFLNPFIIGIGSDQNFAKAFDCMGKYFDATSIQSFNEILNKIFTQTLKETSVVVNLLDINNKPTETDVNISFLNSKTGYPEYNFVHYMNSEGKSDKLVIDAIPTYDIIVNTIPKVIKKGVEIQGGRDNIINIKSPQGFLSVKGNLKEYNKPAVLITQIEEKFVLNVQEIGAKEKYLVGNYDIEVLTLPRTYFRNVKIEQSRLTTLSVESPGILNISENIVGFGSLYHINASGEQTWVCNLPDQNSKVAMAMQPGKYNLVFRSKKSTSSSFTITKPFEINSGATTNLKIY